MILRKATTLILVLTSITLLAQKPAWTDYYKRMDMYPDNEYITGFVSGVASNNEDPGKVKSVYESMAKDKVIQSIQVEIETNNSLIISNTNGKSNEGFVSNSVSMAKAEVNGLVTQSYYDRRKKEVFAIATVNKKELAFFYRNRIKSSREDIGQLLVQGREYVKKGKKEMALKSFYQAMPLLQNIDEARTLLIALNRKMYADIDMDEVNRLNLEVNNEITNLVVPKELTLSEAAYFVAYGLYLQLGDITGEINLDDFSFENTGLVSPFSKKLKQEFASSLVDAGNYRIGSDKGYAKSLLVTGNYWKEGDFIKLSASAYQHGKLIAASKGSVPLSWLVQESVDYIPEQIILMKKLSGVRLSLQSAPEAIKLGMPVEKPVEILMTGESPSGNNLLEGYPVVITNSKTNDELCSSITGSTGIAMCYLPEIESGNSTIGLLASINIADYLNISKDDIYYTIACFQNPVNTIEINIATQKPTIFIQSSEKLFGKQMDIPTLEPVVKETLAGYGYNFVSDKANADYLIVIDANTTTGTEYDGIKFAYLDVNMSVVVSLDKEEVIKIHLDQIKGGGINDLKAGKKAYLSGSDALRERLQTSLFAR